MGRWQKYYPFFAAALLLYVALLIIYPHYQYYIDPDGTAYLTISKRYAAGDIQRAINGYWSPWACWLTAGLIRCGYTCFGYHKYAWRYGLFIYFTIFFPEVWHHKENAMAAGYYSCLLSLLRNLLAVV